MAVPVAQLCARAVVREPRAGVLTTVTAAKSVAHGSLAAAARAGPTLPLLPSCCAPGMLSVGLRYRKAAALPPSYHQPLGTPSIIVPIAVVGTVTQSQPFQPGYCTQVGTGISGDWRVCARAAGAAACIRDADRVR